MKESCEERERGRKIDRRRERERGRKIEEEREVER